MGNTCKNLFAAAIISVFIFWPFSSYAYDHDGHDHGHDHGYDHGRGHSYVGINLSVWPDNYYYGAPYYPPADEVLISPSVYQPVVINGITYYLNDGTYFVYNGYGYQAVAPPVTVVQAPTVVGQPTVVINQVQAVSPAVTTPDTTGDDVDSMTINIPNNKGGYTAVTLKKSGTGFIGPQGEFYPAFPKVSQLKVIYGN